MEWERHTGSKGKNWKISIKVKDSSLLLEKWVRIDYFKFDSFFKIIELKFMITYFSCKWTHR